jgi:hypothetical protein
LLDNNLKHPAKASQDSGLDLAGALPVLDESLNKEHPHLSQQLAGLITAKVKLVKHLKGQEGPVQINLFSTQAGEGKSTFAELLWQNLNRSGEKALLLKPGKKLSEKDELLEHYDESQASFISEASFSTLSNRSLNSYKYLIFELPAMTRGIIPVRLIEQADVSLFVARADKSWSEVHKNVLSDYQKITKSKVFLLLNGIRLHYLDQLIGEVPIRRSKLVRWVRRIVRFEFSSTSLKTQNI